MSTPPTDAPFNSNAIIANTTAYTDEVYALSATGGFTMERGFDDVKRAEIAAPVHVDVTNSVQVLMDVATFNAKLGLVKNATNTAVSSTSFSAVDDFFKVAGAEVNEISISSAEFTAGISKSTQVISVGKYETLYSGFQSYVAAYFGFDGGFSSLFTAASEFSIDTDNTFNGASFKSLLTASAQATEGRYISALTGSITISNITKLLKYAVDANVFGNRTPGVAGTAVNGANNSDYGVADGFIAGDLIWVPAGTTIKLHLDIDNESFNPLNNIGVANASGTATSQSTAFTTTNFPMDTSASTTVIDRVCTAPLLIKLVDASTIAALA
jgi:hypothetical protein